MANSLSPQDRDLMIRTIIGEAGNQGPQGQAAVANVILNRVAAGKYGKTPSDVVLAPNQFEPWSTRSKELMSYDPNSAAYKNVGDIVDMVSSGDIPDQTSGATHFLNPDIVRQRTGGSLPNWASKPIARIGQHTFYAPNGPATAGAGTAAPSNGDVQDLIDQAINSGQ
jgi:spore germination cell wall hydrolase CwlJ-like protein